MEIDFTPYWNPLEVKVGNKRQEFTFIGRLGRISCYKHILSDRYLYLDDAGNCYVYRNSKYEPADFEVQMAFIEAEQAMTLRQK